jgi:hypothetical protein
VFDLLLGLTVFPSKLFRRVKKEMDVKSLLVFLVLSSLLFSACVTFIKVFFDTGINTFSFKCVTLADLFFWLITFAFTLGFIPLEALMLKLVIKQGFFDCFKLLVYSLSPLLIFSWIIILTPALFLVLLGVSGFIIPLVALSVWSLMLFLKGFKVLFLKKKVLIALLAFLVVAVLYPFFFLLFS